MFKHKTGRVKEEVKGGNRDRGGKKSIFTGEELNRSHVAARVNGFVGGYGKKSDFDAEWQKLGLNDKMAEYIRDQVICLSFLLGGRV